MSLAEATSHKRVERALRKKKIRVQQQPSRGVQITASSTLRSPGQTMSSFSVGSVSSSPVARRPAPKSSLVHSSFEKIANNQSSSVVDKTEGVKRNETNEYHQSGHNKNARPETPANRLSRDECGANSTTRSAALRMCVSFSALMAANYMLQSVRDAQLMFVGKSLSSKLLTLSTAFSFFVGPFAKRIAHPTIEATAHAIMHSYRLYAVILICGTLIDMSSQRVLEEKGNSINIFVSAFYVLTQTLNNLSISVLWSFSSDILPIKGAVVYFSMFGAACTIGQAFGSLLAQTLLEYFDFPVRFLLPLIAIFLEISSQCAMLAAQFHKHQTKTNSNKEHATPDITNRPTLIPISAWASSWLVETKHAVRILTVDPFNIWLSISTVCYSATLSFIYLERTVLASSNNLSVEDGAALSARISLVASILTFGLQIGFSTSTFAKYLGVQWGLLAGPVVTILGFLLLYTQVIPPLQAIVIFELFRRVTSFGISKPVRESLYAIMPRESKFAVKSVMDTVVYRGGMGLGAMVFDWVSQNSHNDVSNPDSTMTTAELALHIITFLLWAFAAQSLASTHARRVYAAHV